MLSLPCRIIARTDDPRQAPFTERLLAKLDQGHLKYTFTSVDLGKMLGEIVHDFQPAATKKQLKLVFALDPKVIYRAEIDLSKVQQVLSNLIDNAIHYTEKGSVTLQIGPGKSLDWVRITVRDTGIGIDPTALPGLFKRYARAENATRIRAEGSGLGLYLARQFVDGHGGRIWAESDGIGKGSTLYVEVPSRQPAINSQDACTPNC